MAIKKGLGKGLDALFGDLQEAELEKGAGTQLLPLQKLEPNPLQPRKNFDPEELDALAESCGEGWDADECYFAAEDWINRKDMDASFAPQSVCAGVLTLKNI